MIYLWNITKNSASFEAKNGRPEAHSKTTPEAKVPDQAKSSRGQEIRFQDQAENNSPFLKPINRGYRQDRLDKSK
jgi:hypothetical protein